MSSFIEWAEFGTEYYWSGCLLLGDDLVLVDMLISILEGEGARNENSKYKSGNKVFQFDYILISKHE